LSWFYIQHNGIKLLELFLKIIDLISTKPFGIKYSLAVKFTDVLSKEFGGVFQSCGAGKSNF